MAEPPKRVFTEPELRANKGKYVKVNAAGDGYEGADGSGGTSLPSQTGHAGEFLTTDGNVLSWGSPSPTYLEYVVYLSQTGTNAPVLVHRVDDSGLAVTLGYVTVGTYGLTFPEGDVVVVASAVDVNGTIPYPVGVFQNTSTSVRIIVSDETNTPTDIDKFIQVNLRWKA